VAGGVWGAEINAGRAFFDAHMADRYPKRVCAWKPVIKLVWLETGLASEPGMESLVGQWKAAKAKARASIDADGCTFHDGAAGFGGVVCKDTKAPTLNKEVSTIPPKTPQEISDAAWYWDQFVRPHFAARIKARWKHADPITPFFMWRLLRGGRARFTSLAELIGVNKESCKTVKKTIQVVDDVVVQTDPLGWLVDEIGNRIDPSSKVVEKVIDVVECAIDRTKWFVKYDYPKNYAAWLAAGSPRSGWGLDGWTDGAAPQGPPPGSGGPPASDLHDVGDVQPEEGADMAWAVLAALAILGSK